MATTPEKQLERRIQQLDGRTTDNEAELTNAVRNLERTVAMSALAIIDSIYKARY